jgi:hypothetical protein
MLNKYEQVEDFVVELNREFNKKALANLKAMEEVCEIQPFDYQIKSCYNTNNENEKEKFERELLLRWPFNMGQYDRGGIFVSFLGVTMFTLKKSQSIEEYKCYIKEAVKIIANTIKQGLGGE